jgi:hypothetical protein
MRNLTRFYWDQKLCIQEKKAIILSCHFGTKREQVWNRSGSSGEAEDLSFLYKLQAEGEGSVLNLSVLPLGEGRK